MIRSTKQWAEIINGKSSSEIAHFLLKDLIGYRSLILVEDQNTIGNLIEAIRKGIP